MTVPRISKEELYNRYVIQKQSAIQIATEFGYSCAAPVHLRIRQCGFPTHGGNRKITDSHLKELYQSGHSPSEIATKYKVATATVYHRLRLINETLRPNPLWLTPLTHSQQEICFGSLLGDAYGRQTKSGTSYLKFSHSLKQEAYLQWLWEEMCPFTTRIGSYKNGKEFVTKTVPQFTPFVKMFYPTHKKIVPIDLSLLTPLALAVWFMDDGGIDKRWNRFQFATCGFTEEDNIRLVQILQDRFGIKSSMVWTGYSKKGVHYRRIAISSHSYLRMKEIIKPYVHSSLYYKLGC